MCCSLLHSGAAAGAEYKAVCRCKGQQGAEKQLSIRCLPQTLALHLKRFEHTSLQACTLLA